MHSLHRILSFVAVPACLLSSHPAGAAEISYAYDAAGRLVEADYGGGKSIRYLYDSLGNVLQREQVAFTDDDDDGMDDITEEFYFTNTSRDGTGDFDKDGQSDFDEVQSGTDPTDPKSLLRVKEIAVEADGDPPSYRIEFAAVAGKSYQLRYSADPGAGWTNLGDPIKATKILEAFVDNTIPPGTPKRFYQVLLVP